MITWEERAPKSVVRLRRFREARYRCFCGQELWMTPNSHKDLMIEDPTELRYLWYECSLEEHLYCHENSTFVDGQYREQDLLSTWYMRIGGSGPMGACPAPQEITSDTPDLPLQIETEEDLRRLTAWKNRYEASIIQFSTATDISAFPGKRIDPVVQQDLIRKLQERRQRISVFLIEEGTEE